MQESVNILGTEYKIIIDDEMHRTERDGAERRYLHEISLRPKSDMLDGEATDHERALRFSEVGRHEILHAFFDESGLESYSQNEQLIDWLAVQSPKIFKVFTELELL